MMLRLALALIVFAFPALAGEWSGNAAVIDGDTIYVRGVRLRLISMDAPEIGQTCTDAKARDYACGDAARAHLESLIRDSKVTCTGDKVDRYKRPLVRCWVGIIDLGSAMVRAGWAVSAYGQDYIAEHNAAARDRVGIWSGQFQNPSDWRRDRR